MSSEMLEEPELTYLARCYCSMYPGVVFSEKAISPAVLKYSQLRVGNEIFGSQNCLTKRSSYILASCCGRDGIIDASCLRPACISSLSSTL